MIDIISDFIFKRTLEFIVVFFLSFIPLYLLIKLVGGTAGVVKTILISIVLGFSFISASYFLNIYAGLFVSFLSVLVYMVAFQISFFRATVVWLIQYSIIALSCGIIAWLI